ncbi:glycine betaine ABC transporter substrate-binding protein, partial [Candidatus Bipolaricaulota bacterium]
SPCCMRNSLAAFASETSEPFRVTLPRAIGQEALQTTLEAYGLRNAIGATDWTETQAEAEALLKFGVANIAIVDNLDETLTIGGFVALEDDLDVFSVSPIVIVLRAELTGRYPEIGEALSDLGSRLTTSALHDLISRVRSLHQPPQDVAREFLIQQGLLTD